MKTYFANPKAGFLESKEDILKAVSRVIEEGDYILGKNVSSFEEEFNTYLGGRGYFVSCASGTDAITLAIIGNGLPPGSKIMVPSHTASATIVGILRAGCIPFYLDVEESSLLVTFKKLKEIAIKEKIKAIVPVHLYGSGVHIPLLKKNLQGLNIKIIEDCAQSTGTLINKKQSGTLGDSGCFSFFPTKNLGALGDGGGIWVPNKKMKEKLITLRQYGWSQKRIVERTKMWDAFGN